MNFRKHIPRCFAVSCIVIAVLMTMVIIISNIIMCASASKYIYDRDEVSKLPNDFDCILVLGAGIYADGTPTPMLNDRLVVACEAYEYGCSDRMIMSGDHLHADYNEPGAMKSFAVEQGISDKVIFLDHAGISTYDSIYRAINIYGAEKILIVTQKYHLYRAIYIAQALGAEAYGVSASIRPYFYQPKYTVREWAARVKDTLLSITKPEATYMGEKIDLSGDGAVID